MKYSVYRLNNTSYGATKSFYKEFNNLKEAHLYAERQHQLLTEREGLSIGVVGETMVTYFHGQELKVVLVLEDSTSRV